MSDTITAPDVNRLVSLARWLTGEERKRRLGKPSEWDQSVWVRGYQGNGQYGVQVQGDSVFWSCGTAACLAGHISIEDGGLPAFYDNRSGSVVPLPVDDRLDTLSDSLMFFGGRPEHIDEHARRALGLDEDQAADLFNGENDYDTVIHLIAQFTGTAEYQLVRMVGGTDLPPDPDEGDDSCDCGCQDEDDSDW